jgi:hypothetical protein
MRVLLACLIVLGAFGGTAIGFAIWGAGKVGPHVDIDTSCMLLDAAEHEGMLSKSERFDVIKKVATSAKLAPPVREAANRLRNACPKR